MATRLEFYPSREGGAGAGGLEEEHTKDTVKDVQFEHGYRLGFSDNGKVRIRQTRYGPDKLGVDQTD